MNTTQPTPVRVAQFGLGPIGISCLNVLAKKSWVEVVGGIDIRPEILSQDLGQLTGDNSLNGIATYDSFEALCAEKEVNVILHTAGSSAAISLKQMEPMIDKGIVVISSCEELLFPAHRAPEETAVAHGKCQKSGARVLGTGVNPGFVLDVLPTCLSGICAEVYGVYGERVVDASTRRQPLQKKVGSGMSPEEFESLGREGKAGHAGFQETLLLVAHALGWDVGPIKDELFAIKAEEHIKTDHFEIEAGQTAGLHQIVSASTPEGKIIYLDLKMYQAAKDPHDLVRLDANPPVEALVKGGIAGDLATVAAMVNAIPRMLKTTPGVKLMTELSLPCCPDKIV